MVGIKHILLLEDNPGDATLVAEYLADPSAAGFQLHVAATLAEALELLERDTVWSLSLVDLNLPDSMGLETYNRLRQAAPEVPTIVLTGVDDEAMALTALRLGAQDYLNKSSLSSGELLRAILFAIERSATAQARGLDRQRQSERKEYREYDDLFEEQTLKKTSRIYGSLTQKEGAPERFAVWSGQYAGLVERLVADEKNSRAAMEQLRDLGEMLGQSRAGPRDVIDLHLQAIRQLTKGMPAGKVQHILDRGRLMLVRLMGYLVTFYKNRALGNRHTAILRHMSDPTESESP